MYQAKIYFSAFEDSYDQGQSTTCDNSWDVTLTDDDPERLKAKICAETYSKWENIELNNINDYPTQTEYWANYLADKENEGDASEDQIESWKEGKTRLWAIDCHILVSKLTEAKATL